MRFYRNHYDAEQVLANLSQNLRDQVDLDKLPASILQTVAGTLQPERLFLWLRKVGHPEELQV